MRALMKVGFSLLVLAFLLTAATYGLLRTQGTARVGSIEGRMRASDSRPLGKGITAVELSGPIDLSVRYGPTPSLQITGEQRLLANIETVQEGGVLHIGPRGILLRHRQPLQAVLVLPTLARLSAEGSGDTTVDGFSGAQIELQLSGSGSVKFNGRYRLVSAALHGSGEVDIDAASSDTVSVDLFSSGTVNLAGTTRELRVQKSGSGELDARHLRADTVTIDQSGSGDSAVHARTSVSATLSGSGDVAVAGNPNQRNINRTGSGDVQFTED